MSKMRKQIFAEALLWSGIFFCKYLAAVLRSIEVRAEKEGEQ
jgi:hypothetical protein